MQHLDEGTIHAWLDGALPPDEAARAEAHVAECTECAAKLAEARGFIAASSRILTALDDVPRGVIPAAPARPRIRRSFLQAAAVLLVVATGGLLIARNRTGERAQAPAERATLTKQVTVTEAPKSAAPPAQRAVGRAPTASARASGGVRPPAVAMAPVAKRREQSHDTTVDIVLSPDNVRLEAVVTTGAAAVEQAPLKVLTTERTGGIARTTYEIAPDRSVTLIEYDSASARAPFGGIAAGRVGEVRAAATLLQHVARASSTSAVIPLSAPASAPVLPAPSPINTIRWTEESTGKLFVLSGPFPVSELASIRQRIERLRSTR